MMRSRQARSLVVGWAFMSARRRWGAHRGVSQLDERPTHLAALVHAAVGEAGEAGREPQSCRAGRGGPRSFFAEREDGFIAFILERIGSGERTFVEIGASDGSENCTRDLAENGWRGVWVEADEHKAVTARELRSWLAIEVLCSKVSRSNAANLIASSTVPNPEVLVVDIDGNDWRVLGACLSVCQPRLVVVEYNATVGARVAWSMPYNDIQSWDGDRWHGVSFGLLHKRAPGLGYRVVACDPLGVNAFLVRGDLVDSLGNLDDDAIYSPPMYSAPFGHPWRTRRTSDVGLAWDEFAQIRISDSGLYRMGELVVVMLEVHNDSGSWLTSFGKHPFNLAALEAGDRTAARVGARTKLCWPVPPHSVRSTTVTLDPTDFPSGMVEFALLQEQVQWLTDVPGWKPLLLDLRSNLFVAPLPDN
ncbi:MAG: hypothetical protein ABI658_17000 [Acidimicrobiales bacterium]